MKERSKIDLWIGAILLGSVLVLAISAVLVPSEGRGIILAMAFPMTVLMLWILFGTYYELREDVLFCRSGPFTEKIPYGKIKSVRLCRNMLSSMALSRHRIEIRQHGRGYITGTTFISPMNRETFLKELMLRCGHLDDKTGS